MDIVSKILEKAALYSVFFGGVFMCIYTYCIWIGPRLKKKCFLKPLPSANTFVEILFLLWTTFCNNIYKNSVFVVGLPSATTFVGIFSLLWDYLLQQLCCGTTFCNDNICRNSLFVVGPPSATTFVGIPSLLWD